MAYMFEYEGADYTLDFDRNSIMVAERQLGISMNDLQKLTVSNMFNLFHAALLKHQPKMKQSTVEMLYDAQEDKMGLHTDLIEMYAECINTLTDDKGKGVTRQKI